MRKQNKVFTLGLVALALISILGLLACQKSDEAIEHTEQTAEQKSAEKEILYYTCGMHPSVRISPEDYEKGSTKCPICNMDVVPVFKEGETKMAAGEHEEHGEMLAEIKLSARAQGLAEVETEEVRFRQLHKEIHTVGHVDYEEPKVAFVAAWVPGRIDKLFVNFTGMRIKKGEPLASIYSPDLLTAQEEYLLALETLDRIAKSQNGETHKGAESLVQASRKKLLLWGIKQEQISELEKKREASTHMTIYAPIGGTVIQKKAAEGLYVKEGQNLYQIADLSRVWVLADIYEYELSWVEKGQAVEIQTVAYPGETFNGKVSFIDPYLDSRTRTVKVRVDVPNSEMKIKPGMFVDVRLEAHVHQGIHASEKDIYVCPMCPEVISDVPADCPNCGMDLVKREKPPVGSVLAVPRDSVLQTGKRQLVYVEKEAGLYAARKIEIGTEAVSHVDGQTRKFYPVLSGLSEGMKVVSHANFLIDSQSQITGQAEAVYSGALERGGEEKKPPAKHIH